ncbi:hypothetical protein PFISCL1PPCAC_1583, partial [Pristionchus fissidentatus]
LKPHSTQHAEAHHLLRRCRRRIRPIRSVARSVLLSVLPVSLRCSSDPGRIGRSCSRCCIRPPPGSTRRTDRSRSRRSRSPRSHCRSSGLRACPSHGCRSHARSRLRRPSCPSRRPRPRPRSRLPCCRPDRCSVRSRPRCRPCSHSCKALSDLID